MTRCTQRLNDVFEGSLSMCQDIFVVVVVFVVVLAYSIASGFVFLWDSCAFRCVCLCTYVYLMLFLWQVSLCLFALPYSVLITVYCIIIP